MKDIWSISWWSQHVRSVRTGHNYLEKVESILFLWEKQDWDMDLFASLIVIYFFKIRLNLNCIFSTCTDTQVLTLCHSYARKITITYFHTKSHTISLHTLSHWHTPTPTNSLSHTHSHIISYSHSQYLSPTNTLPLTLSQASTVLSELRQALPLSHPTPSRTRTKVRARV